jgi:hypothetical protein
MGAAHLTAVKHLKAIETIAACSLQGLKSSEPSSEPLSRHTSAPAAADTAAGAAADAVRTAALSEPTPATSDSRAAAGAGRQGEAEVDWPLTPAQASVSASPRIVTPDTAAAPDAGSTGVPACMHVGHWPAAWHLQPFGLHGVSTTSGVAGPCSARWWPCLTVRFVMQSPGVLTVGACPPCRRDRRGARGCG